MHAVSSPDMGDPAEPHASPAGGAWWIVGGRRVDPAGGPKGATPSAADDGVRVHEGRIVERFPPGVEPRRVDASGCVIMAGAVEMHAHLASGSVEAARAIQYETGYGPVVPSVTATGVAYARLGYTTGVEAAVSPAGAADAARQLDALPVLDTAMLLLTANHDEIVEAIEAGDDARADGRLAELIANAGAFGFKAVNPLAVTAWRRDPSHRGLDDLDRSIPSRSPGRGDGLRPIHMLERLIDLQQRWKMPHPVHIHAPRLGKPDAGDAIAQLLGLLRGYPLHLAHLQYYTYRRGDADAHVSDAERIAGLLDDTPGATADLGLVAFGPAFTVTGDLPLEYGLIQHAGSPARPARLVHVDNEDCFGVMPMEHRAGHPVHAVQFATGLELALRVRDPWKLALSVDHPNGGSFTQYPELIALLMSRARRDAMLERLHPAARKRTRLAELGREYTLEEIAVLTRAAPARILGLAAKGRLTPGADGDVVVYRDDASDPAAMFARPRWVLARGEAVITPADDSLSGASALRGRRHRATPG